MEILDNLEKLIMPSRPIRHHYVPQHLIRNFQNDRGQVFYFDKDDRGAGIQDRNPDSIFMVRHLYSEYDAGGNFSVDQEHEFTRLENTAAPIFSRILERVEEGREPGLSITDRSVVHMFIYQQYRRVPEVRERLVHLMDIPQVRADLEARFIELQGFIREDQADFLASDDNWTRIGRNASVGALSHLNPTILQILKQRGLTFLKAAERKTFILGSQPIIRLTPPHTNHLEDPQVQLWLPISANIAVGPGNGPGSEDVVVLDRDGVRQLNLGIWRQSRKVASKSRELLESLMRKNV